MRSLTCVVLLLAVFSLAAQAQQASTTAVPNLINYSGTLYPSSEAGAPPTVVGVTFAIYRQQEGGAPIWMEMQNVTVDASGHYSALLGSTRTEGIPPDLFSGQEERWLGVKAEGQPEQPRVMLVSVPYAFKAHEAETLGGLPASAYALSTPEVKTGSSLGESTAQAVSAQGNTLMNRTVANNPPITGTGTTNYVPLWTSSTNLGNSAIYQLNGNVGIGTTTPTSMLTVVGSLSGDSVNSSTTYEIGGSNVVSTAGTQNLFLGKQAGQHNTTGGQNTFSGNQAGSTNTTGSENSFFGNQAGLVNLAGRANTFMGNGAGQKNTSGSDNTFLGARVGLNNTGGNNNIFAGFVAGYNNTTGSQNVFLGNGAGLANTTGQNNTFLGWSSGNINVAGTDNVYLGYTSGQNATGSNNIYLGEVHSALSESNTIRIGTNQASAYMTGIYGNQPSGALPVVVNSNGQLGTTQGSVVTSWNGRTGAVVPQTGDYSFSLVSGILASSQLSGTYGNALTLSNTSNAFAGNGSGLTGVLPAGGSPYYIQNGTTQQTGASFKIDGNGTLGGILTANVVNVAANYQIGGSNVLSAILQRGNLSLGLNTGFSNTSGSANTFIGDLAGYANGSGYLNTFLGYGAGNLNTTGTNNTFVGGADGASNNIGQNNTFVGSIAGNVNTTGSDNVFLGYAAGGANVSGGDNTFLGAAAGQLNTSGSTNLFVGIAAGASNTTGSFNAFVGDEAGASNTTGQQNTFIGALSAGIYNTTGSYDVYISNPGSPSGESHTMRIGDPSYQANAYIAGIYGSVVGGNGVAVYVDSNGQLGTTVSSRRFKEQIRDMGDSSTALMRLRPVTFLYKPEFDKGQRTTQYGLIAEEVADVYPDLVAYDPDGKPYTVKYQYLTTMLLNEMQKQYHRAEAEAAVITQQEEKIDALEQRLSRLEAMLGSQTGTAAVRPQAEALRQSGRSE